MSMSITEQHDRRLMAECIVIEGLRNDLRETPSVEELNHEAHGTAAALDDESDRFAFETRVSAYEGE
jgi:hypothetical protein